ncbi:hypothetical protein [Luteimicrobium subarcticum]|uniref:Uncharacterized protein n=1 Tax=Luteimicrobium subarcticum TaxID=620910 RepID=A0A2M8WRS7_9MICO|nr:hypothetical protein [Luteimicrobium subarcticum]PJI93546.1 hypothetical protein CLV34_2120 [Luteimicrobium subarcticum]
MSDPYYARDFLNTPGHHGGAYVLATVETDADTAGESLVGPSLDARLTVSDCGRVTTLNFVCYEADDIDNALHKARLLRRTVDEFAAALEEHAVEFRRVLEEHVPAE